MIANDFDEGISYISFSNAAGILIITTNTVEIDSIKKQLNNLIILLFQFQVLWYLTVITIGQNTVTGIIIVSFYLIIDLI